MHIGNFTIAAGLTITLAAAYSSAGIIETGGDAVVVEPPSSILLNHWESSTEIRTWFERETTLTHSIQLGHSQSGLVDDSSQLSGDTIIAGTQVQSYMIRLDSIAQNATTLSGYLEFDTPILGVLIGGQLNSTDDIFGRPGVLYNTNRFRGMELTAGDPEADAFEISTDMHRINFTMETRRFTDDIRVITAVPSSGSLAALSGGVLVGTRRRRSA